MTDERLRELERRFRASGSVEDEAAWLRARVQAGELEQSRLELGAYLGYHAAKVCGLCGPEEPPEDLREWWFSLWRRWGREPFLRAWAAMGRRVLAGLDDRSGMGLLTSEVVVAVEDFLVGPNPQRLGEIHRRGNAARHTAFFGRMAFEFHRYSGLPEVFMARPWTVDDLDALSEAIKGARLKAACGAELAPWALGYRDPVRERVEARQREAAGE